MKVFILLATLAVSAVYADDAPYPPSGWRPQQQALLVLPPQFDSSASNYQASQNEGESIEKINDNVMERLRQEEGSERGVYYVYLPDGKLQRVQYTTAPIKQQDNQQTSNSNQQTSSYSSNYEQQQYSSNQFNKFPSNNNVQTNHQQVGGNNQNSYQGNQQQFGRYQQQFGESRQQAYKSQYQQEPQQQQYNGYQSQSNGYQPQYNGYQQQQQQNYNQYLAPSANQQQQNQQKSDNKEAESGDPSQLLARYSSPDKLQNVPSSSYVASVQFTDVPPITGPIYSYNPAPLVRIVRYASNYQ